MALSKCVLALATDMRGQAIGLSDRRTLADLTTGIVKLKISVKIKHAT